MSKDRISMIGLFNSAARLFGERTRVVTEEGLKNKPINWQSEEYQTKHVVDNGGMNEEVTLITRRKDLGVPEK